MIRLATEVPAEAAEARAESTFTPVVAWAWAGGLLLVFQLYVWGMWITGPYFTAVPPGPSDPPTWMKTVLTVWTGVIVLGWPVAVYHFLIKPWRRERRITTDGPVGAETLDVDAVLVAVGR